MAFPARSTGRSSPTHSLASFSAEPPARAARRAQLAALELGPANVTRLVAREIADGGRRVASGIGPAATEAQLHGGATARLIADAFRAEAVTIGRHVFAPPGITPAVLRHEMAHVAQGALVGPWAGRADLEREAASVARGAPEVRLAALPGLPLFHPALRVLLRAGTWLARRTTKTLSKHVARHGRRIAARAVHSVFRNPREIKSLVSAAVRDATALARKYATRSADEVLEEGGIRVMRQATGTPGKFRTVVQKDFGRSIGTRGERILRVVLDESGRVVTAFPADRLIAIGTGVVAVEALTARSAEASEQVRTAIEREENRPTDWGMVALDLIIDVVSLGLLASSPANEGEDLQLRADNIVWRAAQETIAEIEAREGIQLTQEQKDAIYELAQIAVGAPLEFEAIEDESSQAPQDASAGGG
jgi:hypothetical protein